MENIKTDIDVKGVSFVGNNSSNNVSSIKTKSVDGISVSNVNSNTDTEFLVLTGINSSVNTYSGDLPYLGVPLESFLSSRGSSVDEVNSIIRNNVFKAGVSTREGAVAAAKSLVDVMSSNGVKLPYISSTGVGGIASGKYSGVGVDPNWGTSGSWHSDYYDCDFNYTGMDCSGFISWVLHNGGYKYNEYHSSAFCDLGVTREVDGSGKPGDILWQQGHVALIIDKVDDKYILAQETDDKMHGLVITDSDFSGVDIKAGKEFTHIIDMSDYYSNSSNFDMGY